MEIANNDWINRKVTSSSCTFPDCKNGSSCQYSSALIFIVLLIYKYTLDSVMILNDVVKVKEELSNFEIIDQTHSIKNECLS